MAHVSRIRLVVERRMLIRLPEASWGESAAVPQRLGALRKAANILRSTTLPVGSLPGLEPAHPGQKGLVFEALWWV